MKFMSWIMIQYHVVLELQTVADSCRRRSMAGPTEASGLDSPMPSTVPNPDGYMLVT